MARIRMIKPEFWDDEKLSSVSRDARLTFIGMWNNADDYAVVKGHHLWLKNNIFPYDEIKQSDFQKWLCELENIRVIIPFESDGEKYYYIKNFLKHQTINRPSQVKNPTPPDNINECSLNTHGVLTSQIKLNKEEIKLKEREGNTPDGGLPSQKPKIQKTKYLDSVFLTDQEYKKLQEAMGQKNLDTGIEQLDYSISVKGGKYKDHYKTILNWNKRGFLKQNGGDTNATGNGSFRKQIRTERDAINAAADDEADIINRERAERIAREAARISANGQPTTDA